MSRLGKKAVTLGLGVRVNYNRNILNIKGQKGELELNIPQHIELEIEEGAIRIVADFGTSKGKMMAGTIRALINNMVCGVSQGFTRTLELVGIGYRAQLKGEKLSLSLGYSHPIEYEVPKIVEAKVEGNNRIVLTSCDKQILGQVIAEIRKFRPPEPYKGKGILFIGENIQRKAGKAAKASA